MKLTCKYCKKIIEKTGKNQKYCCLNCCQHDYYNHNKEKIKIASALWQKKNPERFKELHNKNWNIWYAKNHEHFNDLCRIPSRDYQRRLRAERGTKGVCYRCGLKVDDKKFKTCSKCRIVERGRKFKREHR